ncbi:MerR family transcriptional regulator [Ferrimonas sediminicola]|uniref:MerR family transcriptional regulator n=1 Tax=Ferrimonas sediminicola TaxID=2569538 RepID=UPI00197A842B|nr:MerR family transcriptional regulator [Ferrimonas sediminicola]
MNTDPTPRYPIGDVADRTGVNPVTLRAWQRRFGLLNPGRTAKGHRLYSELDIERIRQILGWLEKGVAISQVKALLDEPHAAPAGDPWRELQQALTRATVTLNRERLYRELDQLTALYPFELAADKALRPWIAALQPQLQPRPDGDLLLAWAHQQLELYLAGRTLRAQQQLPGEAALLLLLRGTPLEDALTACALSLGGERFSQLTLSSLDGCQLLPAQRVLCSLPARLHGGERRVLERIRQRGASLTAVGPLAAVYRDDPLFKEADHG